MTLHEFQQTLFSAIATDSALNVDALGSVVNGGALTPQARVEIYAEMYWLRMRDTLRADFSATLLQLGDEAFDIAVAKYIQKFPSTHFSLGTLGRHFADLLYKLSPDVPPALADLAALEWAHGQAFVAADGPTLSMGEFAEVAQTRFTDARLQLAESVRTLSLNHQVATGLKAEASGLQFEPHEAHWVVWRKDLTVFHSEISANEYAALQRAREGAKLPEICECFVDADDPATAAFQAIGSWVNEGMVRGVSVDEVEPQSADSAA